MIYLLIDLKRREQGIRHLVCDIEKAIIKLLAEYGVAGHCQDQAPGVYVDGKKIASIGLRVRKGCTYHGISFNYDLDLTPFSYINPCGYANLAMTRLIDLAPNTNKKQIENQLSDFLKLQLCGTSSSL